MTQRIALMFKALRQLGWSEIGPYLRYQFLLRSGILRWRTRPVSYEKAAEETGNLNLPLFPIPEPDDYRQVLGDNSRLLLKEADQISSRQVRLFGGKTYPLTLNPGPELSHWTRHTVSQHQGEDIKIIWEAARFGWATTLARAYLFSGEEKYAAAFWLFTEEFLEYNPPNIGPQWASGQEVSLRMMALTFSLCLLTNSPYTTTDRLNRLKGMIATHANRISATLDYARAQNNNHLVSEAAGLYTAAVLLPDHPRAEDWRQQGGDWLNYALQTQISPDGTYTQHSTNYLRLVLQLALFIRRIAAAQGEEYPDETLEKLGAATRWLELMLDKDSGSVPNLGGNDGAYFLPLTTCPYADFRPVVNAARFAFLGQSAPKDEMGLWLAGESGEVVKLEEESAVFRLSGKSTWAVLRAAEFNHRPAHADQLHLDLWWQGINMAADPGVYQYNARPPWRNPLDTTAVHNTLTVNGLPQMTKASHFLWLDWAQAEVLDQGETEEGRLTWIVAQHDRYRKLNLAHRRTLSVEGDLWMVRDQVLPMDEDQASHEPATIRQHWLLPDWDWQFNNGILFLNSGRGDVTLQVRCIDGKANYSLARAGECLLGNMDPEPFRGWFSPTYAEKVPTLSFVTEVSATAPLTVTTNWTFPE